VRTPQFLHQCCPFLTFVLQVPAGEKPFVVEITGLSNFGSGIAKDRDDPAGLSVCVHKCATVNAAVAFPADGEVSVVPRSRWGSSWVPIAGESGSKLVIMRGPASRHPRFSKEYQRANGDKASVIFSRPALNVFYLLARRKSCLHPLFPWSTLDLLTVHAVLQIPVESSSNGTVRKALW
jgi:hypothetical protein